MSTTQSSANNDVTLTYKYLLIFSTACAVFFCWLYVTKPTTVVASTEASEESVDQTSETKVAETSTQPSESTNSFEALNQDSLPGDVSNNNSAYDSIPIASTPSTESSEGFEETNDKVQHIITAQNNTTSERIIIEVPVIYQTRGLRLDPQQAQEAQRVLRALKIYQSQLKKLHQDGLNIQKAWNNLLLSSQPIDALRADSPSLPQTNAAHPALLGGNSSNTIKVSN